MNYLDGVFERTVRIAYYECGQENKIKLSNLLRHTQEIASRHLDVQGYSYQKLEQLGTVFLLSRLAVKLWDIPRAGEELVERTWAKGTKGAYFLRDCTFLDKEGRLKVEVSTMWILVDPQTHSVLKPSSLAFSIDMRPDLSVSIPAKQKIKMATPEYYGHRPVRFSDIDCNHHINNAVYADICCDFAHANLWEKDIRVFAIHFAHEAKFGEDLAVFGEQSENDTQLILAKTGENVCFEAVLML